MSDRERILGYAVGGIVALIVLFGAYRVVKGGFDAKKTTLADRLQTLRQETQINKQSKRDRILVGEFQRKSLTENQAQAQRLFKHWLEQQVKEVGLSNHRITFDGMPRTKKTVKELSYLVSGEGDVKQVKDFLYRVHSADTLHRVRTIDLQKSKNVIKMSARIDAVSMPKIQGDKVAIGTANEAKLSMPLDGYNQIVTRNMFSPGNEAPRFKSLRTKTVSVGERLNLRLEATDPNDDELTFKLDSDAPDWLDISKSGRLSGKPEKEGRHTFKVFCTDRGIPSKETVGELTIKVTPKKVEEKPKEEEFDESKLAVLTAIVQGRLDPLPQMCMYMRSKDESQYLQEGDRLKVGKWRGKVSLVDPDTNTVLLQNDDGEFELRLGDALSDARRIRKNDRKDDE